MNAKEKNVVEGIVRDISHDMRQYQDFLLGHGGLSWDGFKDRLERRIREMKELTEGTYFLTYGGNKQ